ncbi:ACP phosphodiesterase [Zoogloea sp.]|jgi:acyl carrier protein phosphodiesterase|uniref:acyl carrier protein phosphodiesterase n=1 Tax=Zoogloea sp. TaxID=49181 RepID=UPI0037D9C365
MNYLAHALLAGPLATDRVGGVAGDFVKGLLQPCPAWLDPALAEGVRLHRRIDSFADTHPAFRRSRARVSDTRKRFGGVLVDMFYDHFLAVHWHHYSPDPLTDFTAETYRLLATRLDALPAPFAPVFARMAAHDWLGSYRDTANVALALDRMAHHRARQPNPLAGAGEELLAAYPGFEADFLDFFPDALVFADEVRRRR